jgi:hypothetical protein
VKDLVGKKGGDEEEEDSYYDKILRKSINTKVWHPPSE